MGILADNDCDLTCWPDVIEQPYGLYPGLDAFSSEYTSDDYREWVDQSNGDPMPAPLAVYIQDRLCQQSRLNSAEAVQRELLLQGQLIDRDRPMQQLLCAGNMLAAYSDDQLYQLIENVQTAFLNDLHSLPDWCAGSGATLLPPARLRLLKVLGFNGVGFILQGGSSVASNLEDLIVAVRVAREIGMQTVTLNFPADAQYPAALTERLKVLVAEVSRVRVMAASGADRVRVTDLLYEQGFTSLSAGWYVRTDDHWLHARSTNSLYWSMVGFSRMHSPDIVGIGPGAISAVGECYSANTAVGGCYQASIIGEGELPIVSGLELEADDILRREIMAMILAAGRIRVGVVEAKWGICFEQFFAQENRQLYALEEQGWVHRQEGDIVIPVQTHDELNILCRLFDRRARVQDDLPDATYGVTL